MKPPSELIEPTDEGTEPPCIRDWRGWEKQYDYYYEELTPESLALKDILYDKAAKLQEIPPLQLNARGEPYIKECADVLLAFAEWFGQLSPYTVSIFGDAWRSLDAIYGASGILDWARFRLSESLAGDLGLSFVHLTDEAEAF